MVGFYVRVGIPFAAAAAIDIDETNAALDQSAGEEAVGAELSRGLVIQTVELLCGFAFARDVDRLRGRGLHAECELVTVGAGL